MRIVECQILVDRRHLPGQAEGASARLIAGSGIKGLDAPDANVVRNNRISRTELECNRRPG